MRIIDNRYCQHASVTAAKTTVQVHISKCTAAQQVTWNVDYVSWISWLAWRVGMLSPNHVECKNLKVRQSQQKPWRGISTSCYRTRKHNVYVRKQRHDSQCNKYTKIRLKRFAGNCPTRHSTKTLCYWVSTRSIPVPVRDKLSTMHMSEWRQQHAEHAASWEWRTARIEPAAAAAPQFKSWSMQRDLTVLINTVSGDQLFLGMLVGFHSCNKQQGMLSVIWH